MQKPAQQNQSDRSPKTMGEAKSQRLAPAGSTITSRITGNDMKTTSTQSIVSAEPQPQGGN